MIQGLVFNLYVANCKPKQLYIFNHQSTNYLMNWHKRFKSLDFYLWSLQMM